MTTFPKRDLYEVSRKMWAVSLESIPWNDELLELEVFWNKAADGRPCELNGSRGAYSEEVMLYFLATMRLANPNSLRPF